MGSIQPPGILGAGHHIATDSKGNIYLAQTTAAATGGTRLATAGGLRYPNPPEPLMR